MDTDLAAAPLPQDFAQIYQLIGGYRISQAIYVAAELGVPDLLAAGPMHYHDLAAKTGSDAPTLYRVLRFLAGAGLFQEVGHEQFGLTRLGAILRTDVVGSPCTIARMLMRDFHWRPWSNLIHSVRTGETAFNQTHGAGPFDYLRVHPDDSAIFDAAMTASSARSGTSIVQHYDFTGDRTVVDIGGGQGFLLATILEGNRDAQGVLLDLPDVIAGADRVLSRVMDRCKVVGGSFFDALPQGGDIYILRQIIHDWQDEQALSILRNCRAAMSEAAKVLLVERQIPPDHHEAMRVLHLDMEMLVNVGGLERTDDQYRNLLQRAGFRLNRILPLQDGAGFAVFEGVPVH